MIQTREQKCRVFYWIGLCRFYMGDFGSSKNFFCKAHELKDKYLDIESYLLWIDEEHGKVNVDNFSLRNNQNEEVNIVKWLECMKKLANEIIVVDTGSTDKTVKIAESYGAKVFSLNGLMILVLLKFCKGTGKGRLDCFRCR